MVTFRSAKAEYRLPSLTNVLALSIPAQKHLAEIDYSITQVEIDRIRIPGKDFLH